MDDSDELRRQIQGDEDELGDGYETDPEVTDEEGNMTDDELTEEEQRSMYARFQPIIEGQLRKAYGEIEQELREKREAVKRVQVAREASGVELYSLQQQLAKLQADLETQHDNFNLLRRLRGEAEEETGKLKEAYDAKKDEMTELIAKQQTYQRELDQLHSTIRSVETYQEEMSSQIKITRRATYKAEEVISKKETEKKQQDFLIDDLNSRAKQLREELGLYEAQLAAQQEETKAAQSTLLEANREMEKIQVEKRQLMQQWKSSLIGMQRRDEALKEEEDAIREQEQLAVSFDNEIRGWKQQLKVEQDEHEKLSYVLNKIQTEISFLTRCLNDNESVKDTLMKEYNLARKTLDHIDSHMTTVNQDYKALQDAVKVNEKAIEKLQSSTVKLEERKDLEENEQITLYKGSRSVQEATMKMRQDVHRVEIEITNLQNELSRVRIDVLNTGANKDAIQEQLDEVVNELKEKEKLIDKYEMDARRTHDEIGKKQSYVDQLNRKYDALTSNTTDENNGPLEATIYNLQKTIGERDRASQDLQHAWVRKQTELVSRNVESNKEQNEIDEIEANFTVYEQKKIRLEGQYAVLQREINAIENRIRQCHNEIAKLNDLIARNCKLLEELQRSNLLLEAESQKKLSDLQQETEQLDLQIEKAKQQKDSLQEELVEAQKQVMLWQKKINLAQETQKALDPEVGMTETAAMKKEVQRMQLRLNQLNKKQKEMMTQMEQSVHRRENIVQSGKIKAQRAKSDTVQSVKRSMQETQADLEKLTEQSRAAERENRSSEFRSKQLEEEVEEARQQCDLLRNDYDSLATEVIRLFVHKQLKDDTVALMERKRDNLDKALNGQYRPEVRDVSECQRQTDETSHKLAYLRDWIVEVTERRPDLQPSLQVLLNHL